MNLIAIGKFHYYDIARLLKKNEVLNFFYNNHINYFKNNNKMKLNIKFDFYSFLFFLISRLFSINLNKYLHQNFPRNYKYDNETIYCASLSLINILSKDKYKKIIIDHGSPNLEYDKKVIIKEIKKFTPGYIDYKKLLPENWVINQENYEFSKSDVIIVPSSFSKKTFSNKKYFKKIKINNIITNIETKKNPGRLSKSFKIIYVGDFSIRKGIHRLLDSLIDINDNNISLTLIGGKLEDHAFAKYIKNLIEKSQFKIEIKGKLSKDKLKKYYEETNLMVFPSLCDGYGIVVNEAISYGIPVICSIYAGSSDIIKRYNLGYTYDPYVRDNLLKKISTIRQEKNYENICTNIKNYQKNLSKLKLKYENFILKAIN